QANPNSNETSILPAHPEPPGGVPVPVPEPPPPALQPEGGSVPASEQMDIQPVTNRSKAKLAVWIALVTLLIAGVALGGWWFGSGRYGDIPQVLGLDEYQAVAVVEEAGLTPVTDTRYHNEVPDGSII